MEKYTIGERLFLIDAVDCYINSYEWARKLAGINQDLFADSLFKIKEIRIKLILDSMPIEIHTEDIGNQHIYDKWYYYCYLCGRSGHMGFPESPMICKHFICSDCFSKYSPVEFAKLSERNARYFNGQVPGEEPADKSLKEDLPF